ncbi:lipase class 3 [Nitzschia inconspicua]|uniref:Lipase class 3 n=1 Tax=Nitzschia inconspicua TaxID=303405 RepID=A0A9K3Q856_9STRA|nr:lipase class 3 [Nitzschia inconspicua]
MRRLLSQLSRHPHASSNYAQRLGRLGVPGGLVVGAIYQCCGPSGKSNFSAWQRVIGAKKTNLEAKKNTPDPETSEGHSSNESFDIMGKLGKVGDEWKDQLLESQDNTEETDKKQSTTSVSMTTGKSDGLFNSIQNFFGIEQNNPLSPAVGKKSGDTVQGMGQTLMKLLSGSNDSMDDVIQQVRDMRGRGEVQDQADVAEVFSVAKKCAKMLETKLGAFFGEEGPPPLYLTNMMYYIERQDELKNPSWKRRKHRFFPGIDMSEMDDCYEKMLLAKLGYEDDIEVIRHTLKKNYNSELVYCSSVSKPNKPAHFVAIKRDQSRWSNELEILVVVCGTKSITDVITDLLCDAEPYRGGLAHSGILESGKWLVQEHTELLDKLRELTGKKKVRLTLVGHSLGAAAATIAGIEWNDDPTIKVEVVGFGCPALLSKDVSQKAEEFVTTVVADSDCIPRMSMASMVNTLMDVTELDVTPYARQDFQQTVDELQRFLPSLVDDKTKENILDNLNKLLPTPPKVGEKGKKRMEVVLFPPGKIIHFYRDGYGVTGSVTPATFFDEIERQFFYFRARKGERSQSQMKMI